MRYTHVLASIPLRVIAVCSVALLALLAHDAAAPRPALANPISVWVININVSAALEGSGFCDPSSAAFYASSLDAIAAGSAGQVSDASQYAGSACLIVKTDGSTSPITVNGRGLVCDTACDGTAASAITPETVGGSAYAAEIIDGYAAGYTSAPITVTQDNVAVDTAPIVPVHQAHDILLSVTKPTVQEAATSCPIAANQAAPTNGLATAVYTDINGTQLVGYLPAFATSNTADLVVGNTSGTLGNGARQFAVTSRLPGGTIAATDSYCGVAAGTAMLTATSRAGEIQGVSTPITRSAQITVTGVPAAIGLEASPGAVPCDGAHSATVIAHVTDVDGNNVADGTPVSFQVVSHGLANPINTTVHSGEASSQITPLAGITSGVVVTVVSDSVSSQIAVTCAPPTDDDISNATRIDVLPATESVNTAGFTTEASEPLPCGGMGATAWFALQLPLASAQLTVDTTGSNFNTALAVYNAPPSNQTLLGCNANGSASSLSFAASSPGTYYIQAGGQGGATGALVLHVTCTNDNDCDGLTNADEATLGTNPNNADTDGDGLSDGMEVHTLHTNPLLADTDGDGCGDGAELLLSPPTDPTSAWDFYSVPVPALIAAPNPTSVVRDAQVAASDAQAVFAYFKAGAKSGTAAYDQDLDGNGVQDGLQYDRTVLGPGHSGPPDGTVAASDAQLAFAQFKLGYKC